MAEITFSQRELWLLVRGYMDTADRLINDAKSQIVQWKYADSEMFGLFPLFEFISFRGSEKWQSNRGRWLTKQPKGFHCVHGFDVDGAVRLIEKSNGITSVFVTSAEFCDQITFGGRANNLKRHVIESDRVVACYDYHLDPHQYSRELFEYENESCVRSVVQSWFFDAEIDDWKMATWQTVFTYEHDSKGLVRAYRDMGEQLGGKELVFKRRKRWLLA